MWRVYINNYVKAFTHKKTKKIKPMCLLRWCLQRGLWAVSRVVASNRWGSSTFFTTWGLVHRDPNSVWFEVPVRGLWSWGMRSMGCDFWRSNKLVVVQVPKHFKAPPWTSTHNKGKKYNKKTIKTKTKLPWSLAQPLHIFKQTFELWIGHYSTLTSHTSYLLSFGLYIYIYICMYSYTNIHN